MDCKLNAITFEKDEVLEIIWVNSVLKVMKGRYCEKDFKAKIEPLYEIALGFYLLFELAIIKFLQFFLCENLQLNL